VFIVLFNEGFVIAVTKVIVRNGDDYDVCCCAMVIIMVSVVVVEIDRVAAKHDLHF
jgi:hypothetical protein